MRFFRYWNRFVTLSGVVLFLLVCVTLIGISNLWQVPINTNPLVPQLTIVPVQPTSILPTSEVSIIESATPTPVSIQGIQVGVYVQITGTNGSGLRIRSNPGLSEQVNFYGMDSEVFLVQDGPIEKDGYMWWFIAAPYDTTRSGWAVTDFLNLVTQ